MSGSTILSHHTSQGERLVQKELRKTLLKYQLHRDQEPFDRAYTYNEAVLLTFKETDFERFRRPLGQACVMLTLRGSVRNDDRSFSY